MVKEEFLINHNDLAHQVMVLYIGAPVSLAGIQGLKQYLEEFDLSIEKIESSTCNQVCKFGPSKRYLSKMMVEIPVIVQRSDGKGDMLRIQAYLVDPDIPFLSGKRTLEL